MFAGGLQAGLRSQLLVSYCCGIVVVMCVAADRGFGSEIRGTRGARVRVFEPDGMGCDWMFLTPADGGVGRPEANRREGRREETRAEQSGRKEKGKKGRQPKGMDGWMTMGRIFARTERRDKMVAFFGAVGQWGRGGRTEGQGQGRAAGQGWTRPDGTGECEGELQVG